MKNQEATKPKPFTIPKNPSRPPDVRLDVGRLRTTGTTRVDRCRDNMKFGPARSAKFDVNAEIRSHVQTDAPGEVHVELSRWLQRARSVYIVSASRTWARMRTLLRRGG